MRKISAGVLLLIILAVLALLPSEAKSGDAAATASLDCGDSIDLPFRCGVFNANEVAPGLAIMRGGGADPNSLSVAAWRFDDDGQVTHVVISGYFPNEPQPIK